MLRLNIFIILALVLSACSLSSQETNETINLDWKLSEGELLAYHTSMNQSATTEPQIEVDFEQFLDGNFNLDAIYGQLANLQVAESADLTSLLRLNSDNNISVQMILDNIEFPESSTENPIQQSFNQLWEGMEGTVQLRGELTPEGSIASFYTQERQRNLLSIFFELPAHPVRVGDKWEIDVNCITVGAGFITNRAERVNQVELSEITQTAEGETIAIIDYVILEAVEGISDSTFSDEQILVSMTCSYLGRGQFLVEAGRWHQLGGEFQVSSTGFMDTNAVSYFTLSPMVDIPEHYRNIP